MDPDMSKDFETVGQADTVPPTDFADLPDAAKMADGQPPAKSAIPKGPRVFGRFAHMIVLVPFLVYLSATLIGSYIEKLRVMSIEGTIHHHDEGEKRLEVDRSDAHENVDPHATFLLGAFYLKYHTFPYTYVGAIALTLLFMIPFAWGYFKAPFRISAWSVLIGAVGIFVWVGLSELDRSTFDLGRKLGGYTGERPAFNPFSDESSNPLRGNTTWLWSFLAIRFFGLVCVVPIIEEFFLRGFLMRYVDDIDWDEIPLGVARFGGWITPTVYGLIAHSVEPLSSIVWFSMVTWLYKKTGSIWDCVLAHAITNLLLGLYVVKFGAWHLW
jgi:hypothetical protein